MMICITSSLSIEVSGKKVTICHMYCYILTCQTWLWIERLRTWWLGTTNVDRRLFNHNSGLWVERRRVRDSMLRVNPRAAALRAMSQRLHRRSYRVAGPNSLWHLDGNPKLKRFVIDTIISLVKSSQIVHQQLVHQQQFSDSSVSNGP